MRACRTKLIPIFMVLFSGILGACSNSEGVTCLTSKDCFENQICVANACQPADLNKEQKCQQNTDCGDGEFCDQTEGLCRVLEITNCQSHTDCPPHQRCQMSLSICVDGSRNCVDDAICSGYVCNAGNICVQCLDNSHCPSGQACIAEQCRDASTPRCSEDSQCLPPQSICENTICSPGCATPGGITCGAGTTCNESTGRCDPSTSGCIDDNQCGAPAAICENGSCTPGCSSAGCSDPNAICDGNTGRCIAVPPPCTQDSECSPPMTVCESGQCVGGCGQLGGVACSGGATCNSSTGRCDPPTGNPACTSDSQCVPPSTICDVNLGMCTAGCLSTSCQQGYTCNQNTGHCESGGQTNPGNGAAFDASCVVNTDCASKSCFDFGSSLGKRCIQACGTSSECPSNATCYSYDGAKMCISSSLYTQATGTNVSFAGGAGSVCVNFGQCQSGYCSQSQYQCIETCSASADCGGGFCRWNEAAASTYIASCDGPQGSQPDGVSCSSDAECQSGACVGSATGGGFKCGRLCRSSSACNNGQICRLADYSVCAQSIGALCLQYQINIVPVCVDGPHGNLTSGSPCTSDNQCRSAYCDATLGQCTGLCSGNSDCSVGEVCKVLTAGTLIDGTTPARANVCRPSAHN